MGTRRNYFSRSDLVSMEFQGTYEFSPRHILTFGAAGNYDRVNANLFGAHPGIGGAAYVQDEVDLLERLKVTVGLRFDWQKVSALKISTKVAGHLLHEEACGRSSAGRDTSKASH